MQQRCVDALRSEDWVDDEVLLYLLRNILTQRLFPHASVLIVDSIVLTLLIDSPDLAARNKKRPATSVEVTLRQCTADFAAALEGDSLLLLPLHCKGHWSLLVYRPSWSQWYCFDSMGTYHRARVEACLEALDRLKLVPATEETRVYFYDDMPRQPQSFECARYVLFYAFVLLKNYTDGEMREDARGFVRRLEREIPRVCEANRPAFEQQLLNVMG